jgi:hypothetical protein
VLVVEARGTAELVEGWWEYQRLASGSRSERKQLEAGLQEAAWAAYWAVQAATDSGGEAALSLVLALLEAAPSDDAAAAVGVGPLEDLLHAHGRELGSRVNALAGQHPRLRRALDAVWLDDGRPRED